MDAENPYLEPVSPVSAQSQADSGFDNDFSDFARFVTVIDGKCDVSDRGFESVNPQEYQQNVNPAFFRQDSGCDATYTLPDTDNGSDTCSVRTDNSTVYSYQNDDETKHNGLLIYNNRKNDSDSPTEPSVFFQNHHGDEERDENRFDHISLVPNNQRTPKNEKRKLGNDQKSRKRRETKRKSRGFCDIVIEEASYMWYYSECDKIPILFRSIFLIIIIAACFGSIAASVFTATRILFRNDTICQQPEIQVQVPCDDLSKFIPVAGWYQSDLRPNETLAKFKEAGIQRVQDKHKGEAKCQVGLQTLMGLMIREEYNAVEGQVTLETKQEGKLSPYSKYPLSVKDARTLHGVGSHPRGLLITQEGNYFVYFGIELHYRQPGLCRRLRFKTAIFHLLIDDNSGLMPRAVMGSEHTCAESHDTERTSVFTGGLFHLYPQDKLFIQVSSTEIVDRSGDNFLGVVKHSA